MSETFDQPSQEATDYAKRVISELPMRILIGLTTAENDALRKVVETNVQLYGDRGCMEDGKSVWPDPTDRDAYFVWAGISIKLWGEI